MRRSLRTLLPLLTVVGLLASGCGDDDAGSPATTAAHVATSVAGSTSTGPTATTTTTPPLGGEIKVFAAASLTDAFAAMDAAFEEAHPDTTVTVIPGPSSGLVQQINEGADADVFASADVANMKRLTDAANASGEPEVFATNELQIITEAGNPLGIKTIADLAKPDVKFVTCAIEVPIGKYTAEVFSKAGVTVTPKSLEIDVKAIVNKVATLGEADAGIVYATDVKAAGTKATGVAIPDDLNVIASYPIVVNKAAENPEVAAAFVAFVLSSEGRAILAAAGFTGP